MEKKENFNEHCYMFWKNQDNDLERQKDYEVP